MIPLNADALEAFRRPVERAAKLGAHLPGHHIFPFRVNKAKWDPNRPASKSWLRKQTARLRERTGIKHIKPHTWRHQLWTEMLEQGVPEETVKGVMGWCSRRMIETYSHTRLAAKADALSSSRTLAIRPQRRLLVGDEPPGGVLTGDQGRKARPTVA